MSLSERFEKDTGICADVHNNILTQWLALEYLKLKTQIKNFPSEIKNITDATEIKEELQNFCNGIE